MEDKFRYEEDATRYVKVEDCPGRKSNGFLFAWDVAGAFKICNHRGGFKMVCSNFKEDGCKAKAA